MFIFIVTDSPYAERAGERKESIKNLMKELSRDAKSICSKDKSKESTAPAASDAESVKSTATESVFQRTRSFRLFRTVYMINSHPVHPIKHLNFILAFAAQTTSVQSPTFRSDAQGEEHSRQDAIPATSRSSSHLTNCRSESGARGSSCGSSRNH